VPDLGGRRRGARADALDETIPIIETIDAVLAQARCGRERRRLCRRT
jgi:hypothetical protein